MDTNALISYLDSHNTEYEEWYKINKEKYLRVACSLFKSLSKCNTSILESTKFHSLLRVLRTFLNKSEIFEEWTNVRSMIDFLLLNLVNKNGIEENNITSELLNILVDILDRTKSIHSKNFLDKKRILDTMSSLLKEDTQITDLVLRILNTILKMEGTFKYDINHLVKSIMNILFSEEDVKNLCFLSKLVLERVSIIDEKTIHRILRWIFTESVSYIMKKSISLEKKESILTLILDLSSADNSLIKERYSSYTNEFRGLWLQFMKISDTLWLLCKSKHPMACIAQEIFNLTVLQFLIDEEMLNCKEDDVIKDMRLFHIDSNQDLPEKYFFFICHMQGKYCRIIWSPEIVLDGMDDWFYNKNAEIDLPVLKSMLFLYPRLATPLIKTEYIALGCDLLRFLPINYYLPKILTFCQIQLVWILKMGPKALKKETLKYWINEAQFHKILKNAITVCKAENMLLNLIIGDFDMETGRIASKFLRKMDNQNLSKEIARMLPFVSKEPSVFSCLLLAKPGIPERIEERLLLLQLLSIIIPSLSDDMVLLAACMYSNDLLENMKREPKCLLAFTAYTSTIKFLLYASYRTEEDVSKEILFLFRNLMSIQVKYQLETDCVVETDPMLFLRGSTRQTNRVLTIFPIIFSSKVQPLVKFKKETQLTLFYQILDYVQDVVTQENALKCLHLMIKNYDWLSFCGGIGGIVRIWCCEQFDSGKSRFYMILIVLWLKKLMKCPMFLRPRIPFTEIQNFFMRSGDMQQINYCSKVLKILQRKDYVKTISENSIATSNRR
ncbi:uncharacterized protein LOC123678533 [Harmonia axyridis]|uniref:uncharacterized protein LOC123678533 n=1 Tax=Harmonia axyridis TaxID=115357 RepID=UPI001E27762B|nr:uncharacterized protein LOC123678533 [Harmonia axyridis]